MKKVIKKIAFLLVIVIVVGGAIRIVKMRKEALNKVPPPETLPVLVKSAPLLTGEFPVGRNYLGTIRAKVAADVSSRVQERILRLDLREGDPIKKGDIICLLDDRVERARVAEIRSKLEAAKTNLSTQEGIYKRDLVLFKNKAVSKEELDLSRARRDAAKGELEALKAELKSALANLSFTRIKAPFSGVVTRRLKDPGDLAIPGVPILSLEATDQGYYVEIKVPQDEFPKFKVGAPVRISLSREGKEAVMTARISRIHPAIEAGTLATVEVDVKARPFGLPTGAVVDAFIEVGKIEGMKVPTRSLLENVGKVFCYFLDDGDRVHIRPVSVVWKGEKFSIIRAMNGPLPYKRVVVAQESALLRLHEGEKVRVLQDKHS